MVVAAGGREGRAGEVRCGDRSGWAVGFPGFPGSAVGSGVRAAVGGVPGGLVRRVGAAVAGRLGACGVRTEAVAGLLGVTGRRDASVAAGRSLGRAGRCVPPVAVGRLLAADVRDGAVPVSRVPGGRC
ncbi:hypothetical protein HCJ93_17525 [Streptomyces sp. SBST2-5]|uniref:Uncharacterized protein n=1 Tax=Streptomyces composti TaxID=2720025 RepID=A0ABX1AA50_9ACTN|nr:hypothetical protein [Streptomyces composti]NJP51817.1 hypothetical protein [Streptomyces composti]